MALSLFGKGLTNLQKLGKGELPPRPHNSDSPDQVVLLWRVAKQIIIILHFSFLCSLCFPWIMMRSAHRHRRCHAAAAQRQHHPTPRALRRSCPRLAPRRRRAARLLPL